MSWSSSPNITFTPQRNYYCNFYNINGGSSITAEVASGGILNYAAVTSAGTFTYNLTKVEYKTLTTCS
jgi:hypothetical protein